jgi:hypothetical protein
MGPGALLLAVLASVGAPRLDPFSPRVIREHVREGDRRFAEGRFERAEEQFRRANRKSRLLAAGAGRAELGFLEATRAQLRPGARPR